MVPPAKRLKRPIVLSSDDSEDGRLIPAGSKETVAQKPRASPGKSRGNTAINKLPTRSRSRPKTNVSKRPVTSSALTSIGSQTKPTEKKHKSGSLYTFLNAAAQTQTVTTESKAILTTADIEADDYIQDDDSLDEAFEVLSQTLVERSDHANPDRPARGLSSRGESAPCKEILANTSQRFLPVSKGRKSNAAPAMTNVSVRDDRRPWADRYGPVNLEELAVHKKKVTDVQNWLENVFGGRDRKRLLVLKGPSGSGKTATVLTLAKSMGLDVSEWKNPIGSEFASEGFISMSAQFEEFLGRSGRYGSLQLETHGMETHRPSPVDQVQTQRHKIILLEEFPNTFSRAQTALPLFRSSVLQYLAVHVPTPGSFFAEQAIAQADITPVVMIISETLVTSTTAAVDSFTAHRLLGPGILGHPGVTMIEFNPIATTFLTKALDLIIQKEARQSGRRRVPGPSVLKKLGEVGDIRSAIGSLEFMCVRGDTGTDWGGRVSAKGKKGAKETSTLTKMEQSSIEMVSQREAALGIFHATGKVVYNKRDEPASLGPSVEPVSQPPDHLPQHARPNPSQVTVDSLMDEIGTDIPTFIAALHENYALSCSRSDGMESVNGCIDALSDSDLLSLDWSGGPGRRGGSARDIKPGSSANSLRQSEISFQVAVRGLLFSLPYPVKRQAGPPTKASNRGTSDTFKMFYPTSLRLWKETEEIESLVDKWTNPFASHGTLPSAAAGHVPEGVDSWSRRPPAFTSTAPSARQPDVDSSTRPIVSGNSARTETILERLPYVATIERRRGGPDPARLRELQRMTQFHGVDAPNDRIPNDDDDDTGAPEPGFHPTAAGGPGVGFAVPTGRPVEKLVLSDDDIEDDG